MLFKTNMVLKLFIELQVLDGCAFLEKGTDLCWFHKKSGVRSQNHSLNGTSKTRCQCYSRLIWCQNYSSNKQKQKGTDSEVGCIDNKSGVKTFHRTATSDKSGVEIIHRMASVGRWLDGWGVSQVTDSPCRASCSATCFY